MGAQQATESSSKTKSLCSRCRRHNDVYCADQTGGILSGMTVAINSDSGSGILGNRTSFCFFIVIPDNMVYLCKALSLTVLVTVWI